MAGAAEIALFQLEYGLCVRRMGAMAQGALAAFERHMRHLLLQEIALVGVAYQAKIRDLLGNVEWSLGLGIDVAGATSHHHAGMNRIAQDLRLAGAVRRMTIRAGGAGHRIAAVRFGKIGRRKIVALLAQGLYRLD